LKALDTWFSLAYLVAQPGHAAAGLPFILFAGFGIIASKSLPVGPNQQRLRKTERIE
jgi:hypothetical protein